MKNIPAKIYLQIGDKRDIGHVKDFNELYPGAITWCPEKINKSDIEFRLFKKLSKEQIEALAKLGSDFVSEDMENNLQLGAIGIAAIIKKYNEL